MLTELKNLLKNSAIYSLGSFSSKLVGFILLPIYTKYFSISEYGTIGILEVTSQILIAIFGLGLYYALNRWYWDNEYAKKKKTIFFSIIVFVSMTSLFALLLFGMFSDPIAIFLLDNAAYGVLITLMAIVSGFEIISRIPMTLLKLQEKPLLYSVVNLIKLCINLILTIYFVVYQQRGIEGIYIAHTFGGFISLCLLAPYVWKNVKFKFDINLLQQMLKFSLPMILASISGVILAISDRYSLRFLADFAEIGIYNLGFKIANTLRVFIGQSILLALTPIMFKKMNDDDAKFFYSKILSYFTFGMLFVVLAISIFGKEIIRLLAQNSEYWPAFSIVPILAFAFLFDLQKNIVIIGINIRKKTKTTALVITMAAIVNIALNVLLIPRYGFIGAAFATAFVQLLVFILIYFFAQRYYPVKYEISKVTHATVIGIIITILAYFGNQLELIYSLILKLVLLLSFPILLVKYKFFDSKELKTLKGIILRKTELPK